MSRIEGSEYTVEAVARTQTKKKIQPPTDASGAIRNTPLQKTLTLKIGARVMLTYNIDTCDCLTNGSFGEIIGFDFDRLNNLSRVIINFDTESSGRERRKNHVALQVMYNPRPATPIDKIEFNYCLSKKQTSASSNAIAVQFPLKLAFAATSHKIQGSTIKKPKMLVIDLRTVKQAAQGYVMLSRVQALSQLIILESVCENKLYAAQVAMNELERMKYISINNEPSDKLVVSCNIRSLPAHFEDLISTPKLSQSKVICLQETWLNVEEMGQFRIEGFSTHLNSIGRGKGIATYFRSEFKWVRDVKRDKYQMTKITSDTSDIINIYRSESASTLDFNRDLVELFDCHKKTYCLGDFNICFKSEENHPVLRKMSDLGFKQLVQSSTHMAGRLIDLVFFFSPSGNHQSAKIIQQSP